jgi:hypothetical protein
MKRAAQLIDFASSKALGEMRPFSLTHPITVSVLDRFVGGSFYHAWDVRN